MLTAVARSRLSVVLVGARNPQNIGSAARAMQDFGFSDLRVVNAYAPPFEAAQMEASSAVGAAEVMAAARLFADLPSAIADCGLVVGTTAIGGRDLVQAITPLQAYAPTLRSALAQNGSAEQDAPRVALLFGSEKTGLTNEQLSFCSGLTTIPLFSPAGRHLSMNLGQSVAVCLYELVREGFEGVRAIPEQTGVPATVGDRERLLILLTELLHQIGYSRRFPANARPEVLRQLVGQLGETHLAASTWMGVFRTLTAALDRHTRQVSPPQNE